MPTEFTVVLPNEAGTLARLGGVLGDARVNIEAIAVMTAEGKGRVQFVPNDADKAARALEVAGVRATTREVLVVKVLDEPGMLGDVTLVMSTAGINIDSLYVTTRGHVVVGVDDLDGAVHVAQGLAVTTFD